MRRPRGPRRVPLRAERAALLYLVAGLLLAPSAWAVGVAVEVSDEAEAVVDSRLARRLIRLELDDVDLPQAVGDDPQQRVREVLFVRLLRTGETLRVELWARGQLQGERRLDVIGTEQYQARRAALASAELARRLRETRILERHSFLKQHLRPSPAAPKPPAYALNVQAGLALGAQSAFWSQSDSVLVGPYVEVWARSEGGLGLALFGAAYSTATAAIPSAAHWTELGIRPSWFFDWTSRVKVGVGVGASLAVLDVGTATMVPSAPESRQTWGARVAARADMEWWFKDNLALSFGPEVGVHLRDIAVQSTRRDQVDTSEVGGFWAGFGVRAVLRQ